MADKTCIVCGKSFEDEGYKTNHEGSWYVLDDLGCRNAFLGNPKKFVEAQQAAS